MASFMKKMKNKASAAMESATNQAKIAKAKTGLASGVLYKPGNASGKFRNAFDLADTEPMLLGLAVKLVNGDKAIAGQIYVTPHVLAIYTISNKKEVHIKLPWSDVHALNVAYCPNIKASGQAPVVTETPAGTNPNVMQVFCNDQTVHTIVMSVPGKFRVMETLMHVTWDLTVGAPAPTLPVPTVVPESHAEYSLHQSEPLLGIHTANVITGNDKEKVYLSLFMHHLAFTVGDDPEVPVLVDLSSIASVGKGLTASNPDPSIKAPTVTLLPADADPSVIPKALLFYTHDGVVHQFYGFNDIRLFYNRFVYAHSIICGFTPVFW